MDALKKWQLVLLLLVVSLLVGCKAAIEVWHTQPDYYCVSVTDQDPEKKQLIVRNNEGVRVFLIS